MEPDEQQRHAAYCDTCQRFDESMRRRDGVPHCRFCGTGLPDWGAPRQMMTRPMSTLIFNLKQAVTKKREAALAAERR